MSILPHFNEKLIDDSLKAQEAGSINNLPLAREFAWDFNRNDFIVEDGEHKFVTGVAAIEIWIYKALKTQRYRYAAYTWDFGHELENIIGVGLTKGAVHTEVKRYLNECLKVNPYIKNIKNIDIEVNGDNLNASFIVETLYSEVKISV